MTDTMRASDGPSREETAPVAALFPATIGRFDDPADRAVIDTLTRWVEEAFREELRQRPSCHVYVSTLPAQIRSRIDRLRDSPMLRGLIERQVPKGSAIELMKHTDELYISHYNKDRGGDQGLFDRHYDGNLRFLSASIVVRALIYLQSDASYRVVFADSKMEKAFGTYDFGLLDFHRELHWVEGAYTQGGPQRILLKCNYLVSLPGAPLRRRAALLANTTVFFVVKAAMEYSKSPRTSTQRAIGHLCNLFRRLNIVHPLLPLLAIAATLASAVAAVVYGLSLL